MVDTFAKLKALNKHTEVYCGHEYTIANLQFALSIDPTNEALVAKYEWGNNTMENCMACVGKMAHKALTFCCCCLLFVVVVVVVVVAAVVVVVFHWCAQPKIVCCRDYQLYQRRSGMN